MKIKRLLEDLEDDLIIEQQEKDDILEALDTLFKENSFTSHQNLNGVAYEYKSDNIRAMFFINTTTLEFKAYFNNSTGFNSNYNTDGDISNIEQAAEQFVTLLDVDVGNSEGMDVIV